MSINILAVDVNAVGFLRQQLDENNINATTLKDYLYSLHVLVASTEQIEDKVNPQGEPFGNGFLTDGYWIIPFEAAAYITRYAMGVPVEFLFHVQQIGGTPQQPPNERMYELWEILKDYLQNNGSIYGDSTSPIGLDTEEELHVEPEVEESWPEEAFSFQSEIPSQQQKQQLEDEDTYDDFDDSNELDDEDPYAPIEEPIGQIVTMPSPEETIGSAPIVPSKQGPSDHERLRNLLNQLDSADEHTEPNDNLDISNTFFGVIEEFVALKEGFTDEECKAIVKLVDLLISNLQHEALTLRKRVKTQEEEKKEVITQSFYEAVQSVILTQMGEKLPGHLEKRPTSEGWINIDPVNASRVAAAEIFGHIAASAHLADSSSEWRDMQFGWGWEEHLFSAISVVLDSRMQIHGSFHIDGSGFQYR